MTDLVVVTADKAATCSVEEWRVIIQSELPKCSEGQINELVHLLDKRIATLEKEAHKRLIGGGSYQEKQNLAREFRCKRRDVFSWYHENNPVPPWNK